jgi:hypothetical protein
VGPTGEAAAAANCRERTMREGSRGAAGPTGPRAGGERLGRRAGPRSRGGIVAAGPRAWPGHAPG